MRDLVREDQFAWQIPQHIVDIRIWLTIERPPFLETLFQLHRCDRDKYVMHAF